MTKSQAVVPKQRLVEVIRQVGFSGKSVAAVLAPDPDSLGLLGCERQFLWMNLSTMGPGGECVFASVKRYLVQLGWGKAVEQAMQGEEVAMLFTTTRFQCKLPEALGWPSGPIPAALILSKLERRVPAEGVGDIQSRRDDTTTVYLSSSSSSQ